MGADQATTLQSSIVSLPYELIHCITAFAVCDPPDKNTVLSLSHVSRTWRTVVINSSKFFVAIDWNAWPTELISTWRIRADHQPLSICLLLSTSNRLWGNENEDASHQRRGRARDLELLDELSNAMANCIDFDIAGIPSSIFTRFSHWFLDVRAPRLQRLCVTSSDWECERLIVRSDNALSLKSVEVYSVLPGFIGTFGVVDITCSSRMWSNWVKWAGTINTLRCLERLTLIGFNAPSGGDVPSLDLPMLKFLKLQDLYLSGGINLIIRSLIAPNVRCLVLESLTIVDIEPFWVVLVSTLALLEC